MMDRVQEVWKRRTNHETAVLCLCAQRVAQRPLLLLALALDANSSPESSRAVAAANLPSR